MNYPAKRYIRMTIIDGTQTPGYAPQAAADPLEAYSAFLFETKEAAEADLNGDIESRKADIAENPGAFDYYGEDAGDDDYFDEDSVAECIVYENGDIEVSGAVIFTRERIFAVYGVRDSSAPKP